MILVRTRLLLIALGMIIQGGVAAMPVEPEVVTDFDPYTPWRNSTLEGGFLTEGRFYFTENGQLFYTDIPSTGDIIPRTRIPSLDSKLTFGGERLLGYANQQFIVLSKQGILAFQESARQPLKLMPLHDDSDPSSFQNLYHGIQFGEQVVISNGEPFVYGPNGTQQLGDIWPGLGNSMIRLNPSGQSPFGIYKGRVFFSAYSGDDPVELWTTDGTLEGTQKLAPLNDSKLYDFATGFVVSGDLLIFHIGGSLWGTDGSTEGTRLIYNGNNGPPADPRLVSLGTNFLYAALDTGNSVSVNIQNIDTNESTRLLQLQDFKGVVPYSDDLAVLFGTYVRLDGLEVLASWSISTTGEIGLLKEFASASPSVEFILHGDNTYVFVDRSQFWELSGTKPAYRLIGVFEDAYALSQNEQRIVLVGDDGVHGIEPVLFDPADPPFFDTLNLSSFRKPSLSALSLLGDSIYLTGEFGVTSEPEPRRIDLSTDTIIPILGLSPGQFGAPPYGFHQSGEKVFIRGNSEGYQWALYSPDNNTISPFGNYDIRMPAVEILTYKDRHIFELNFSYINFLGYVFRPVALFAFSSPDDWQFWGIGAGAHAGKFKDQLYVIETGSQGYVSLGEGSSPTSSTIDLGYWPYIEARDPGSGRYAITVGERLLFYGNTRYTRPELLTSDFTSDGTYPLFNQNNSNARIRQIENDTGPLYQFGDKALILENKIIWISDGTPEGTRQLVPYDRIFRNYLPSNFHVINDEAYFFMYQAYGEKVRLWKTDGTPEGTRIAFELPDGVNHAYRKDFRALNDHGLFAGIATVPGIGEQLFVIQEGFPEPLYLGSYLSASDVFTPTDLIVYGAFLYVHAETYEHGREIYRFSISDLERIYYKRFNSALMLR